MDKKISNSSEIVMGLHWDPAEGIVADAADLDAVCLAFDEQGRVLDAVHPGHCRNQNGSIVHTGDAVSGASTWDDERIFVFLDALPAAVDALGFIVVSASRHAFSEVRGAACHLSDPVSEDVYVHVDLTALAGGDATWISMLRRNGRTWEFRPALGGTNTGV